MIKSLADSGSGGPYGQVKFPNSETSNSEFAAGFFARKRILKQIFSGDLPCACAVFAVVHFAQIVYTIRKHRFYGKRAQGFPLAFPFAIAYNKS